MRVCVCVPVWLEIQRFQFRLGVEVGWRCTGCASSRTSAGAKLQLGAKVPC